MSLFRDIENIENAVITADAMHCQTKTADLIYQGKGDDILQVKNNQGKLYKEIKAYFHKTYRESPKLLKDSYFKE